MNQNLPPKRQSGEITNFLLYAEARRRWPGYHVSQEMLTDAAKITGQPFHVPATNENCRDLYREMEDGNRARQREEATRRDLANMKRNFGPLETASGKGA